ncbi:MAG TPA: Clp protease N-terminal domain-containing protein [Micromonosporaceae bacterium]|nr:Clp protease N-terminal domain-containing protein [Micromonosporaceae bacterium]
MFERFTREARAVAIGAQNHARSLSHHHIGTEHVLLALLDETSGAPASILTQAGLDQQQAKTHLVRLLQESSDGLNDSDAEALESIGIDLNAVKAKIEEAFGPGAFEPVLVPKRRWWFGRKRLVRSPGWHLPFTPRAKKVLELALREALRLKHNFIGSQHILLGMIREGEGLGVKIMVEAGVDLDKVRQRAEASLN